MKLHISITFKAAIACLASLFIAMSDLSAQEQKSVNMRCKIKVVNKRDTDPKTRVSNETVYWGWCRNLAEAQNVVKEIENAVSNTETLTNLLASGKSESAQQKIAKKYSITTKANGRDFPIRNVRVGWGIVVVTRDYDGAKAFEVKDVKNYEDSIVVYRIPDKTRVIGKRKPVIVEGGTDPGNGTELFELKIPIDTAYIQPSSRIILQIAAVDCRNEDTVAYVNPLVYEGDEYHTLQNRRKYFKLINEDVIIDSADIAKVKDKKKAKKLNDKRNKQLAERKLTLESLGQYDRLAPYFHSVDNLHKDSFSNVYWIDTVIVYKKPKGCEKLTYKGPFQLAIEDYHKVYYRSSSMGTCLRKRPFKFLDFSVAIPEMELTDEFAVDPEKNIGNDKISIDFIFQQGRATLTDDSINDVGRETLESTIRQYGNKLLSVSVTGTASPEGTLEANERLAGQRANFAVNEIRRMTSGVSPSTETKIYTWEDVAKEFEKKGMMTEAEEVRATVEAAGTSKLTQDAAIKKLSFYEEKIVPVRDNLRKMQFKFEYVREIILDDQQVVEEFYKNKAKYISGEKQFSNGDFYNLFENIEDSADLDTITIMAYEQISKFDEYYLEPIAPYVMNRMARLKQRIGEPDTMLLKPLLDDTLQQNVKRSISLDETYTVNRPSHVVTQATLHYAMQNYDRAQWYLNYMEKYPAPIEQQVEGIENLIHYMNIRSCFGSSDPKKMADFETAKEYLLSVSNENKAVLYAEMPGWVTNDEAEDWVNLLDDNDPKKWYLKGLIWARKAEEPHDYSEIDIIEEDTTFYLLTEDQEYDLQADNMSAYVEYKKKKNEYAAVYGEDSLQYVFKFKPVVVEAAEDTIIIDDIKPYLAYFDHCFEMAPHFRRHYFNEGLVNDEMREKYPYKKKDRPAYRKAFKILKKADDERRKELIEQGFGEDE